MARIVDDVSRTFDEFLLLPGLTTKAHMPAAVSLQTPLCRFNRGETPRAVLNIPFTSAAMQAVSGSELAIALARKGGCAFIFCSQSIESQAQMVREVKEHKAGFVVSDSNLAPTASLAEAVKTRKKTGHSTIAVTEDGSNDGKFLGLLVSEDFWEFKDDLTRPVVEFYTPVEKLVTAQEGITLQNATELLWKQRRKCLPVLHHDGRLHSLVFRRDYFDHRSNPDELTDAKKRLFVGAAINTHDYRERAKALIEAGADCLCVDSSDGFTEWQGEAVRELKAQYGDRVVVGGGNVVTCEGFLYLVECGADFVKVGIGGGSICTTREQKGIGRGQASAVMEVANARDKLYRDTGVYVPVCSDGGLNHDTNIIMALALGSDFVMMGKYFAMTDESPTGKINYRGRLYKPYWGEGSNRARNWQRYNKNDSEGLVFEEGVDAYVPYSGTLTEKVDVTVAKIKGTMCNIGVLSVKEFHDNSVVTLVSAQTFIEGGTSNVEQLDRLQSGGGRGESR